MPGAEVEALAAAAFGRRLASESDAPLAVALSGGGDSMALLHLAAAWARAHGRRLLALTVDHGLQPASAGWTVFCAEAAAAVGADFRALRWEGDKPAAGLPAAARAARHALLADAARAAGASVILMGHTQDDLAETALMRDAGSTTPFPSEWSASPSWPEGRGLFLLRPLLAARRQALRAYLRSRGLAWIEDPANQDPNSARARARARLAGGVAVSWQGPPAPRPAFKIDAVAGAIVLKRDAQARHLGAACLCAAGTARPPRGPRLERLKARLAAGEDFVATLAGARIEARGEAVRVDRNVGERARGGLRELPLTPYAATVWDGRYEIAVAGPGWAVKPLSGLQGRLSQLEKAALKNVPAAARGALPALVHLSGTMICPILAEAPDVRIETLSGARFRAATGLVEREIRA